MADLPGYPQAASLLIPLLQRVFAKESTTTPMLTSENTLGLEEGFRPLIANQAVDILHHGCIPEPDTPGVDEDGNYGHELTD